MKKKEVYVVSCHGYNITVNRQSPETVVIYSKAPIKPDPNQMKLPF
jgi:hypothetical protein